VAALGIDLERNGPGCPQDPPAEVSTTRFTYRRREAKRSVKMTSDLAWVAERKARAADRCRLLVKRHFHIGRISIHSIPINVDATICHLVLVFLIYYFL
jgi:hypothetical protein